MGHASLMGYGDDYFFESTDRDTSVAADVRNQIGDKPMVAGHNQGGEGIRQATPNTVVREDRTRK